MDLKAKLKKLGLPDDQIEAIIEAHNSVLKDAYIPKHRFDEVNNEKKNLESEVSKRDNQIKELEKFKGTDEELKAKIADLEKQNKESKEQFNKELNATKLDNAIKNALNGKVQDVDIVRSLLQMDTFKLNEKGEIEGGFTEQIDKLKTDKAFLFVEDKKDGDGKPSGFKVTGKTPDDGSLGGDVDPTTAFVKGLAQSKVETTNISNKASEHYFKQGGN